MSVPAPCTRHPLTVWMAYCSACTAWHLAVEIARRDGMGSRLDRQSTPAALRSAVMRAAVSIGAAASLAVEPPQPPALSSRATHLQSPRSRRRNAPPGGQP
jgi:hypothetical protein